MGDWTIVIRKRLWLVLSVAALCTARAGIGKGVGRPNVLLIMTDDQGYGDLSLHGNPHLKTPNLDKLARQGVEFTRFYVSPVCAPTRASLLTGRYNLRSGVFGVTAGQETMRPEETTLAEALGGAGYRTALFGKWHLGEHYPYVPHAQGFDEFVGFRTGHWMNYFDTVLERNGKPFPTRGFISDVLTDEAIQFIRKNRDKPFFLYLAYNAPHAPFQVPARFLEPYKGMEAPEQVAAVYAMVGNLDENIGRLLKALDQLRLSERTIVLFLTDNGPNGQRFNAGLRGAKGSVYEGGVRAPFFLRWRQKIQGGKQIHTIAAHIDVYPTILELCGVARPKGFPIDGLSIVPLIYGKSSWPDRMLFTHREAKDDPSSLDPGAVRTQRFNLVNRRELYDMEADPGEKNNVAQQYPDKVRELREAYENWYRQASAECGFNRMPIPVGYAEEDPVALPAPQSYLHGSLRFFGRSGFAHDWITGWTSTGEYVHWEIDVARPGRYDVAVRYLCPKEDLGSRIAVTIGSARLETMITKAALPIAKPNADVIPRTETPEMNWEVASLGTLSLPAGRTALTVKALHKAGVSVMDLKEVLLKRVD